MGASQFRPTRASTTAAEILLGARAVEERRQDDQGGDSPARSGERRLAQPSVGESLLPPTPHVIAQPTRITTGRYAVVAPPTKRTG